MDAGSPISLDLNFDPSFNSAINGRKANEGEMRGLAGRHTGSITLPGADPANVTMLPSQQRASVGSISSPDMLGDWSPSQEHHLVPDHGEHDHSHGNDSSSKVSGNDRDRPPTWSELKTKAGKERKRLPLACIACRRKKIKCSGEKPACKHCMRARIPCVYKITARKAAPRTDYMAMLDKRLKRMEDRVIRMIPKEDLPDLNKTGRSSVKPPIPGQLVKKDKVSTNKRSAEDAFTAELNDWTQPKKPVPIDGNAQARNHRDLESKLITEGADALPPPAIQEHLAELFFDCVYGQAYLLLHKPSFMRKLKAGNIPPVLILAVCAISARFSTHPQVSTEPAFLRGRQWATAARTVVEKRHFEPNITILTAMLILGLHYFGTCEGGLSWSFGGQAMRLGYALQLHRELDHDPLGRAQAERFAASGKPIPKLPELSFTDREIRRRLMWACYSMDVFNSSGTERPSFLNEEYIKIQLPIKESHFQLEVPGLTEDFDGHVAIPETSKLEEEQAQLEAKANMGVAAYVIRGVVIWKRIVQYLNLGGKEKDPHPIWDELSQFASLQRQITQLKSGLPDHMKYTPENLATHVSQRLANQFLFLHIIIAQTSLFLHRFAIPTAPNVHRPYPPNTPKDFLARCATSVVEAAGAVSQYIADSTGHTLTAPFAGYCAYASATVHVWGIFSKHPALESSSKESLRHNYRYLTRMKRYWGMFHYMAESIKDIYRAFADANNLTKHPPTTQPRMGGEQGMSMLMISADHSRAPSPSALDDGNTRSTDVGRKSLTKPTSPSNTDTPTSGKLMLQYGDWFDRYPHGVSEHEWEATHMPHKKDAAGGAEGVLSQQSDLQSVEEFFASLSPPSKAVEQEKQQIQGQRGKKIPRRRGKSVAENLNTVLEKTKDSRQHSADAQSRPQSSGTQKPRTESHPGHSNQVQSPAKASNTQRHDPRTQPMAQTRTSTTAAGQPLNPEIDFNASDIDIPMSDFATRQHPLQSQHGTGFEHSGSPSYFNAPLMPQARYTSNPPQTSAPQRGSLDFEYNSPSTISNPASSTNPFSFNYTSALPHLDRQMVFGAYAGFDPSTTNNSSALNNPNNLDFWSNPWESQAGIDLDGLGELSGDIDMGFGTGLGSGGNTMMSSNDDGNPKNLVTADNGRGMTSAGTNQQQQGRSDNGTNSTAWFMPFNIEPPVFPGFEDFGMVEDMDLPGN